MKLVSPRSLAARLGILLALTATIIFGVVGTYLYKSLQSQLESHNDHILQGRINQIRHILAETTSIESIQYDPIRFTNLAVGRDGIILILRSAEGKVLFQNSSELDRLPDFSLVPLGGAPTSSHLQTWTLASGLPVRGLAAWASLL